MAVEDFGDRPATEAEVVAWKALVRAGKNASHGYRLPIGQKDDAQDNMRPRRR